MPSLSYRRRSLAEWRDIVWARMAALVKHVSSCRKHPHKRGAAPKSGAAGCCRPAPAQQPPDRGGCCTAVGQEPPPATALLRRELPCVLAASARPNLAGPANLYLVSQIWVEI
eukprot:scaffold135244_cov84-Phaeocystis_antarctica.AAC.1